MSYDAPAALYEVMWGRLRLWCALASTTAARTIVQHKLATGSEHPLSDRGEDVKVTTLSLVFDDDIPGETLNPHERFVQLREQVKRGDDEILVHPLDGSFYVKVEDFQYDVDEDSNIVNVTLRLLRNAPLDALRTVAPSAFAGQDNIGTRATLLSDALDGAGITSSVPSDAVAAEATWMSDADGNVPTGTVLASVASTSTDIGSLIDDNHLEDDYELWDCYRAAIMLGEAVRSSAQATLASTDSTFTMQIVAPMSVLALATRLYGGAAAADREQQIRDLNDIRAPGGMLAAGTSLIMPRAA